MNAPDTTQQYFFQLYANYVLLAVFAPGLTPSLNGAISQF